LREGIWKFGYRGELSLQMATVLELSVSISSTLEDSSLEASLSTVRWLSGSSSNYVLGTDVLNRTGHLEKISNMDYDWIGQL
jgi:hypothetical protein